MNIKNKFLLRNEPAIFSDFPPIYNSLIFYQTRIGWKQLFVDRFVYEWSDLQQDYLVLQRIISKKYSRTSWITGVIQIIWKHVSQNWDTRNADLHGVDAAMRESAKYAQAQRETEEIYSQCSLVQPRDRDVFYSNTNEHFEKEPTACGVRQWLNTWKPLLLRSIQDGVLTALIPSTTSFPPFQLLEYAQLNWLVVLAPLTGGRARRSTARQLCHRQCSSV